MDKTIVIAYLKSPFSAERTIKAWRVHYNTVRPHSSLEFLTPEQF